MNLSTINVLHLMLENQNASPHVVSFHEYVRHRPAEVGKHVYIMWAQTHMFHCWLPCTDVLQCYDKEARADKFRRGPDRVTWEVAAPRAPMTVAVCWVGVCT